MDATTTELKEAQARDAHAYMARAHPGKFFVLIVCEHPAKLEPEASPREIVTLITSNVSVPVAHCVLEIAQQTMGAEKAHQLGPLVTS